MAESTVRQKTAVVTASTAGIGLSVALSLAKRSYHVIVSSRSGENVDRAVETIRSRYGPDSASGLTCHVGSQEDRERLLQAALVRGGGVVDALVLNAAVSTTYGACIKTTEEQWDKMFDVNVKSNFMMIKRFAPVMKKGSSIVLVTSIAAYTALPGLGAYSISKTALLGMCKVFAVELAKRGIRVNAVAPGLIQTKFSEKLWQGEQSFAARTMDETSELSGLFHIPMKRLGKADDIGGVVAFLISDEAAYITGETIVVAGGARSKL